MEYLLQKVSQQAVSFAIRSGIVVTSQFAIKQCSKYVSSVRGSDRKELRQLQERLESKIRIISPAIDLIEIISARGNTSLESALHLTKELRASIQALGQRLADLTSDNPTTKGGRTRDEVQVVMAAVRSLLVRIEDAVPLISLAVSTSGVNVTASIPHHISASRLLQASTLLTAGDTAYASNPFTPAQVGASFTLALYMLFSAHTHRQDQSVSASDFTWQEVISKCRVKLVRTPLYYEDDDTDTARYMRAQYKADEYAYELVLIEDLDDGRVHEEEPEPFEDVARAGLRVRIPVHEVSKMFYTTSGKLLGIEESSSPILLLKRDKSIDPPRRLVDKLSHLGFDDDLDHGYREEQDEEGGDRQAFPLHPSEQNGAGSSLPTFKGADSPTEHSDDRVDELPKHLDPEWLAFEVYTGSLDDSNDEDDEQTEASSATLSRPSTPPIPASSPPGELSTFNMHPTTPNIPVSAFGTQPALASPLSILEMLLRLTILQNYQQASHLCVHDELLNLFLSDEAWGGTKEQRRAERDYARNRIGFDPFDSERPRSNGRRRIRSAQPTPSPLIAPQQRPGMAGAMHLRRDTPKGEIDSGLPPMTPSTGTLPEEEWTPDRQLGGQAWEDSPLRRK